MRRKRPVSRLQAADVSPKEEHLLPVPLPLALHEPRHPHPEPDLLLPREQVEQVRRVHHRRAPVQRPHTGVLGVQHVALDERRAGEPLAVPEQPEAHAREQSPAQVRREQPRRRDPGVRELADALAHAAAEVEECVVPARLWGREARHGESEAWVCREQADAGEAPQAEAWVGGDGVCLVSLCGVSSLFPSPAYLDGGGIGSSRVRSCECEPRLPPEGCGCTLVVAL